MYSAFLLAASGLFVSLVSGHGLINGAVGDAGGKGIAFGVTSATDNSPNDVTIFSAGNAFGKIASGAAVDPAKDIAATQKIAGTTLPQVNKQINLTFHQINGDGAGPVSCALDTAGKGTFTALTVATNVPGTNGKSNAANQNFPLVVNIPAGTACTASLGTVTKACLVKCSNPTFGGVVAFQMAAAGAGTKSGRWVNVKF